MLTLLALLIACRRPEPPVEGSPAVVDETVAVDETAVIDGTALGLQGAVRDVTGLPLSEVQITVAGATTETDEAGLFVLPDLRAAEDEPLMAVLQGYGAASRSVDLRADAWTYTELSMAPATRLHLSDPSGGGTVETESGVSITFPPGAVFFSDGSPVQETVEVDVALIDAAEELRALPQPYSVTDEDGEESPVLSFGAVDVQLTVDGVPVVLDEPVELRIPLSGGATLADGESVALYTYDPEDSRWTEATEAWVEGAELVAEVTHFTWYGAGVPIKLRKRLCASVVDPTTEVGLAGLTVESLWFNPDKSSYIYGLWETDEDGYLVINAPVDGTMTLQLSYGPFAWGPFEVDLATVSVGSCETIGSGLLLAVDNDEDDDGFPGDLDPDDDLEGADCVDDPSSPARGTLDASDIHPAATETWYDGVDQDCGGDDDFDQDGDGDRCDPTMDPELCPDLSEETRGADCADQDDTRSSLHTELCDDADIDEDCDETSDDADLGGAVGQRTWFIDEDGDCWGGERSVERCDPPGDPDELCGRAAATAGQRCTLGGYVLCQNDCDDTSEQVFPGAPESCVDADHDYNCDLEFEDRTGCEDDPGGCDEDGSPACDDDGGLTDCDDGDSTIGPLLTEECDDVPEARGIDEDCDGMVDEVEDAWFLDRDGDGHGDPTGRLWFCRETTWPKVSEEAADDCDDTDPATYPGLADDDPEIPAGGCATDADGDGYGAADWPDEDDAPSDWQQGSDCDDSVEAVNPGEEEHCATVGVDDDCDGDADESTSVDADIWFADLDDDGWLDREGDTVASCTDPGGGRKRCGDTDSCTGALDDEEVDCDDDNASIHPEAAERCATEGIDDDCDGELDEDDAIDMEACYADADGDGFVNLSDAVFACQPPEGYIADGEEDCDDTEPYLNEIVLWFTDADGDGYGETTSGTYDCGPSEGEVAAPGDCDDADLTVHPDAEEACDGVDMDCDGVDMPWQVDPDVGPYTSIQDAITDAEAEVTICVHEGTYEENVDPLGKALTIRGFGEVTLVGTTYGPVVTIASGEGPDTLIAGLIITGGEAELGGGIYIADSSPTLEDLTLFENAGELAGGGIYVQDGAPTLSRVTIEGNYVSSGTGGGLYVEGTDGETLVLTDCTIQSNEASGGGGGLSIVDSDVYFSGGSLSGNNGTTAGGGIALWSGTLEIQGTSIEENGGEWGGGLYLEGGTLLVDGASLRGNDAGYGGGIASVSTASMVITETSFTENAAFYAGAGLLIESDSNTMETVTFQANGVEDEGPESGGAIFVYGGALEIRDGTFSRNWATVSGGAIAAEGADLIIESSTFTSNTVQLPFWAFSTTLGGGLFAYDSAVDLSAVTFSSNGTDAAGGAVYWEASSGTWSDVILSENQARSGGGLYLCECESVPTFSTVTLSANGADLGGGAYIGNCEAPLDLGTMIATGNTADRGGGYVLDSVSEIKNLTASTNVALEAGGGVFLASDAGATLLEDVHILENVAPDGGGLYIEGFPADSVELLRGRVAGNIAENTGGGICSMYNDLGLTLENLLLIENQALYGGAVFMIEEDSPTPLTILNSVLASNIAAEGSTLYTGKLDVTLWNSAIFANVTTVADENAGINLISTDDPRTFALNYLLINANDIDALDSLPGFTGEEAILYAAPLFTDTSSADPLDWILTLSSSSPLIDAGDPSILDPDGSRSDIGAYGGPEAAGW